MRACARVSSVHVPMASVHCVSCDETLPAHEVVVSWLGCGAVVLWPWVSVVGIEQPIVSWSSSP